MIDMNGKIYEDYGFYEFGQCDMSQYHVEYGSGILDSNGKQIFEKDVCGIHNDCGGFSTAIVTLQDGIFYLYGNRLEKLQDFSGQSIKVLRTIHDDKHIKMENEQ